MLSLAHAQLEAETILLRLQEAGRLPPVPVGWPPQPQRTERDRIVLLPDGHLECMACENQAPLIDAVPIDYLSDMAQAYLRKPPSDG